MRPLLRSVPAPRAEPLAELARAGAMVELSGELGSACTSAAVSLVAHAQSLGETVAWVEPEGGGFYPPDVAAAGIDLAALLVVHVPRRAGAHGLPKAAELLLRSGAFDLVIVDLREGEPSRGTDAWQGRLRGLLRQHSSRLVLLTKKKSDAASLGSLVSLRVEPRLERTGTGELVVRHRVLKDKTGINADPAPDPRTPPRCL